MTAAGLTPASPSLDLDGAAGGFDLVLDLFGLGLVDAFLDRLGGALDEGLGFGQAQRGDRADFLDHLDLLAAVTGQDDVELGLLLDGFGGSATTGGGNGDRGGGGNAPRLFEGLGEFGSFHDGQLRQVFYELGDIGHV